MVDLRSLGLPGARLPEFSGNAVWNGAYKETGHFRTVDGEDFGSPVLEQSLGRSEVAKKSRSLEL